MDVYCLAPQPTHGTSWLQPRLGYSVMALGVLSSHRLCWPFNVPTLNYTQKYCLNRELSTSIFASKALVRPYETIHFWCESSGSLNKKSIQYSRNILIPLSFIVFGKVSGGIFRLSLCREPPPELGAASRSLKTHGTGDVEQR